MGKSITRLQFIQELENELYKTIMAIYRTRWDENAISSRIAQLFAKEFSDIEIRDFPSKIKCRVYENNKGGEGSDENRFGDMSICVKIKNHNLNIEGVSFLEAKRIYEKKPNNVFDGIKPDQMKRIFNNAPFSFLLLYDFQPINSNKNDWIAYNYRNYYFLNKAIVSHSYCCTVPLNVAIQTDIKSRELYRFSSLFSEQMILRFFNGHDLNFNPDILQLAKGYLKNIENRSLREFEPPKFLFCFSIADAGNEPENIEVSSDNYTEIVLD